MRLIGGVLVAALLAALASDAAVFGIEVWKIALALLGVGLFVLGGRKSVKSKTYRREHRGAEIAKTADAHGERPAAAWLNREAASSQKRRDNSWGAIGWALPKLRGNGYG